MNVSPLFLIEWLGECGLSWIMLPFYTFCPGLGTAQLGQNSSYWGNHCLSAGPGGEGRKGPRISSAFDFQPDYLFPTEKHGSLGKEENIRNVSYLRKSSTWKPSDLRVSVHLQH